jgi:hypothetical protein
VAYLGITEMSDFQKQIDAIDTITKAIVDEGKIIEAGWVGFKLMVFPNSAPEMQLVAMRQAFFAGAQHLYTSILRVMDPGDEPTDDDINRMTLINKELRDFIDDFEMNHIPTEGSA